MPSEDELEVQGEMNPEMDGNMKFARDVRGYDGENDHLQEDESQDDI